LVPT